MKLNERGVLPESDIYIYNSSLIKKDYFYQMLCIGHYFCCHTYSVKPNTLDSYLLLYVADGSLYTIDGKGEHNVMKAGQLAILNCYERPSYGTTDKVEFYWIHFDSHDISQLYDAMETRSVTVMDRNYVRSCFSRITDTFRSGGQPSEALVNKYITNILTEFFESGSGDSIVASSHKFEAVCNYINANLDRKISNEELSGMVNMSPFHFIRTFKKEIGFTPHEFIQRSRINSARFFLQATNMSLTDITYRCGFANEAAFSNSFKAFTGMTPLQCRHEALGKLSPRRKLASMNLITNEEEDT